MSVNPLDNATTARAFLQANTSRHFVSRIPIDRCHVICLGTVHTSEFETHDIAGVGETEGQAIVAAAGEAAETLSQQVRREDLESKPCDLPDLVGTKGSWLALSHREGRSPRIAATLLGQGSSVAVPMACVLRGVGAQSPEAPPLSEGCAAGVDLNNARLAAVFELIERHAVALWWRGGRPARLVERGLMERQGGSSRAVTLLDFGGSAPAPVAGMMSTDPEGRGFAFASACRSTFAHARAAAARELAQLELGVVARHECNMLDARKKSPRSDVGRPVCVRRLLGKLAGPSARSIDMTVGPPEDLLVSLAEGFEKDRIQVAMVDLTRNDIGAPVIKAISPDLEPSRLPVATSLIKRTQEEFGAPSVERDRVSLY